MKLLNEAQEKLEERSDVLHEPHKGEQKKVRTYRQRARKEYLKVATKRRPSKQTIRAGIRKQLHYLARNLRHREAVSRCEKFGQKSPLTRLSKRMYRNLWVIAEVYRQQKGMYEQRSHTVADRIVSIHQPPVRPIVRGKVHAEVEFGAKISVAMVDGYAFWEKLSWDAYNEAGELKKHIENYHRRFGYDPPSVHVDGIFRNRENRAYCHTRDIHLAGPSLGRPPKDSIEYRRLLKGAKEAEIERVPINYGWSRITSKLKTTRDSSIAMTVLVMDLEKILRDLFLSIFLLLRRLIFFRFNRLIFAYKALLWLYSKPTLMIGRCFFRPA